MNNRKIVTICGSMRFAEEMKKVAVKLELDKGYIVIQCIYIENNRLLSDMDIEQIGKIHYEKIDISDAIYVVNKDGYIGESTSNEITYAIKQGKEIIYHEPVKEEE